MRPPEDQVCRTLIPFDRREAISVKQAAGVAATSGNTIRNWCIRHGIGRRVGGGVWRVSKVALKMLLDGDMPALAAYVYGDRSSELVLLYFSHFNLNPQDIAFAPWSPARLRQFAKLVQSEEPSAVRAWLAERGVKVRANAGVIETYSAVIDELTSSARRHQRAASDFDARMLKSNLPRLTTSAEGAAVLALTLEGLAKAGLEQMCGAACAWQTPCSPYDHFRDFAKRGFKP